MTHCNHNSNSFSFPYKVTGMFKIAWNFLVSATSNLWSFPVRQRLTNITTLFHHHHTHTHTHAPFLWVFFLCVCVEMPEIVDNHWSYVNIWRGHATYATKGFIHLRTKEKNTVQHGSVWRGHKLYNGLMLNSIRFFFIVNA